MQDLLTLLFTGGGLIAGLGSALCAALLPLAVLGGLAIYLVRRERRSRFERETARSWASTQGVVIASTIQVRRIGKSRSEIPVVVYRYEVDGIEYQGNRIRAGDRQGRIRLSGDARGPGPGIRPDPPSALPMIPPIPARQPSKPETTDARSLAPPVARG